MELLDIKTGERTIEIVHPRSKQNVGLRINLVALEDERMTKAKRAIQDRANREAARGREMKQEDIEENSNDLIYRALNGWEWYNPTGKEGDKDYDSDAAPSLNGDKEPEFTRKNVLEMLRTPRLWWIRKQIADAMSDTETFFDAPK
jgi:hypothetical protein